MDDKTLDRIRKLKALAERGVGGEKETAEKFLQKMMKEHGIQSLEELLGEKTDYFLFSYNGKYESAILRQVMYKVLGAENFEIYVPKRMKQKYGVYCTNYQSIEIALEYDFYKNAFYEELDVFIQAFIQKQYIFPLDAPVVEGDVDDPDTIKKAKFCSLIKKQTRNPAIECR